MRDALLPRPAPGRGVPRGDERGAALVEFALIAPILFALLFGMFSGGIAYNRKLALTNGVREGSRYGATLAVAQAPAQSPACVDKIDCWLAQVATVTQQASEGELGSSAEGARLCVAYVFPDGTGVDDRNRSLLRAPPAADAYSSGASATCFADGRPSGERRVQVSAQRAGRLEVLLSTTALTLRSQSVTRFEAAPS